MHTVMALEPCEMCRIYLGKIPESLYIVPFQHKHTRTLTFENFCLDDLEILISNHIDFALTENLTDWPVARKAFFFVRIYFVLITLTENLTDWPVARAVVDRSHVMTVTGHDVGGLWRHVLKSLYMVTFKHKCTNLSLTDF